MDYSKAWGILSTQLKVGNAMDKLLQAAITAGASPDKIASTSFVLAPNPEWQKDDFIYTAGGRKYVVLNPQMVRATAAPKLKAALEQ